MLDRQGAHLSPLSSLLDARRHAGVDGSVQLSSVLFRRCKSAPRLHGVTPSSYIGTPTSHPAIGPGGRDKIRDQLELAGGQQPLRPDGMRGEMVKERSIVAPIAALKGKRNTRENNNILSHFWRRSL
ncbi:unnamed protein product [Lasius platythorax]|uniref:Uncharacterized protein n=1 Tax=Lasius platythorax TaxID=488582 RepID=A0AAV2NF65_9HYME